jgi:predicted dehydrogenase
MMRAALIGVTHWHVPLMLRGFSAAGLCVSAVWDPDRPAARAVAAAHGARVFDDLDMLLDHDAVDCAFVSGPVSEMPARARAVIARGIPFSLEKPCALTAAEVEALHAEARAAGVFVAVPLIQRHSRIAKELTALAATDPPLEIAVRFIAGPPQRYERWNSAWMLDPARSGGGAGINLAAHFVDLAEHLAGSPAADVTGLTSADRHGRAVEDLAVFLLRHVNGAVTDITVGYRFPDAPPHREFRMSVGGRAHYVETDATGLLIRDAAGSTRHVQVSFDTDDYYADFVVRFVADLREKREPEIGLEDMARALAVIEAGYRSAREGRRVALTGTAPANM